MIVARILHPGSKLATVRGLSPSDSTMSSILGLAGTDEDDLYEAMDWLLARQAKIEKTLAKRHLTDGSLVLFDVSSSYYTGRCCPLAKFGHSRDDKRRFPQIVYGLLCDGEGRPVAIEVFEGNTADPMTLGCHIEKLRRKFGLRRVVIVGDRGLLTEARIREELEGQEGLDWVTALRAPAIRKLVEQGAIQMSLFDERDMAEVTSPEYPGERLVVCRNPLLADERTRKREELLQATEKELEKVVTAVCREKRPLRGKDQIGLRVGKVIGRFKMAKHFIVDIGANTLSYRRDQVKIQAEAALDGVYVIRTSVEAERASAAETVEAYKRLSRVERAFRCLKTVDLKIRPIYHHLADRVKAHALLCMLAYYVEWHLREGWRPLLFEDEEKESAAATRVSLVAPAPRSPSARSKDLTKRGADDEPVHSFRTLLTSLLSLTKNRVRAHGVEIEMLSTPTPLQSRAFSLLGLQP
jgi:transposase